MSEALREQSKNIPKGKKGEFVQAHLSESGNCELRFVEGTRIVLRDEEGNAKYEGSVAAPITRGKGIGLFTRSGNAKQYLDMSITPPVQSLERVDTGLYKIVMQTSEGIKNLELDVRDCQWP